MNQSLPGRIYGWWDENRTIAIFFIYLKFVECGECGRDVSVLVEAYASEEASFSTIMALQKGLCPSSDLDLETEDDVKECQQFMEDFMPIALRQIADYVIGNRRKFCNELFDVCTLDPTNEVRNGILLPKLFWPTVRKYCSSTMKGQNIFW